MKNINIFGKTAAQRKVAITVIWGVSRSYSIIITTILMCSITREGNYMMTRRMTQHIRIG
ncbi:hypothetical protein BCR42DRAFT_410858 [Absidia repens]|uniref:Uncharacterized protein n=1 Tax=Absidia repens TaxID=90262 RepID=A0A1X2IKY9_9FUNG|nr:hypothetical protein BCR42DRAFT_410858 [Absidia repens]